MAVKESRTVSATVASDRTMQMSGDRYCRHCSEIALAYDPSASRPRCRSCGELA